MRRRSEACSHGRVSDGVAPRTRRARRFAVFLAVAALAGASATLAQAASSDRAIKACLLARETPAPRLVIYGSSRAEKLEPSYLGSLLGEAAFNASVSSGTPDDAWAFAHLAHDQAGGGRVRALWLVDLEALRPRPFDPQLLGTPTLARYFVNAGGPVSPAPEASHGPAPAGCSFKTNLVTHYAADGFRARDFHDAAAAHGATLADGLRRVIGQYRTIYRTRYTQISPDAVAWLKRTLAAFNSWGVTPVLVLTPAHPAFLRAVGPDGWNARHDAVVKLLRGLPEHFTLLDASQISVFGGRPGAFYDGIHMRIENTRRLADWIVKNARPELTGR
jgi:hypothetical protein